MEVRLVQLLSSFIGVSADYALARLEFAMHHPTRLAPPLIDRLPDASEATLRERWPKIEVQLENALRYTKQLRRDRGNRQHDTSAGWLLRTTQELDQYARAIRWVLTVTEK